MATAIGLTATVQVDDGASGAYVDIANVQMITLPDYEHQKLSDTIHGQTSVVKHYKAGMVEGGNLVLEALYDGTELSRFASIQGVSHNWKVKSDTTNNKSYTYPGFLQSIKTKFEPEALGKVTYTVVVTGTVILA